MRLAREICDVLHDFPEVDLAVLFGSTARETARSDSDVDIGVRIAGSAPAALMRVDIALGRALRKTIDLVDLNTAPPLLRLEIAQTGIVLIEKHAGTWSSFRVRALNEWSDFAPLVRSMQRAAIERLKSRVADAAG